MTIVRLSSIPLVIGIAIGSFALGANIDLFRIKKGKPISICGGAPVAQLNPNTDKAGAPPDPSKYQSLSQRAVSFPLSAEASGEFKNDKAIVSLNIPTLLCVLNEHGQAYGAEAVREQPQK